MFEAFGLGIVLVITAIHSLATEDISNFDESAYLANGLGIRTGVFPRFTDGATYSDLYFVLSHVTADPARLFFLGRMSSAVVFVLGVWTAARLLSNGPLAWTAAAATAVMPVTLAAPGVSSPATAILLVSVALIFRRPGLGSLGVVAGLIWIAAGSRPELIWVATFTSATAIISLALSLRGQRAAPPRLLAGVLVVVGALAVPFGLAVLHGSPFASDGREWFAFQQHYSLRHGGEGLSAWSDAAAITQRAFPDASGLVDALRENPEAFGSHVMANIWEAPGVAVRDGLGLLSPGLASLSMIVITTSLLAGLALSVALQPRSSIARLRDLWTRVWTRPFIQSWAVLAAICLSSAVSVAVVFPRIHYLMFAIGAAVVVIVALQAHVGSGRLTWLLPVAAVSAAFFAFSVQVALEARERVGTGPPVSATAAHMVEAGHGWRVLGSSRLLTLYVPNLTEVNEVVVEPGDTFAGILAREGISVVLKVPESRSEPWTSAPGFTEFIADPQSFGFAPFVDGAPLLLRTDAGR